MNLRRTSLLFVGMSTLLLGGCRNPCQSLCGEMADAFDACGIEYSSGEVSECIEDFSVVTEDEEAVCQETRDDLETLLEMKSGEGDACEELAQYE